MAGKKTQELASAVIPLSANDQIIMSQNGVDVVRASVQNLLDSTPFSNLLSTSQAASKTFVSTSAGLANTVSGQAFLVTTSDPQVYNVYQNNAGSAVLLGVIAFADGKMLQDINGTSVNGISFLDNYNMELAFFGENGDTRLPGLDLMYTNTPDGIVFADPYGQTIAEFLFNGSVYIPGISITSTGMNLGSSTEGVNIDYVKHTAEIGELKIQRDDSGSSIVDPYGQVIATFKDDGTSSFSGFFFGADGYMAAPNGEPIYFQPYDLYSFEGTNDPLEAVGQDPITIPPTGVFKPVVTNNPFYFPGKDLRVMSSQQIPSVASFPAKNGKKFPRIVRANYGVSGEAPGTSGETNGCYVRISYSDDNGATWTHALFVVPEEIPTYNVLDPHIHNLKDGRLLVLYPYSRSGRWVWGFIVENPTDDAANWVYGDQCFLERGFVGRPRYKPNGDLLGTVSEPMLGLSAPYTADQGAKVGYFSFFALNRFSFNRISYLPTVEPGATYNDFQEVSINRVSGGKIRAIFRTQFGYYVTYSTDNARTWSNPVPVSVTTTSSRCDETYSPSGRLILAHNNNAASRTNIALSFTQKGADGSSFIRTIIFDSNTNVSYPSITFGVDQFGQYDGYIYLAYDRGRGKTVNAQSPTGYLNELHLLRISETSIFSGKPYFTATKVIN